MAEIHEKLWGREEWIVNNAEYCGKKLIVKGGFCCSIHYHLKKHETFYLQTGCVYMERSNHNGTIKYFMYPGDSITIERGNCHRFTGISPTSEIIEFSTQHFEDDSHRTEESKELTEEEMDSLLNLI